MRALEATEQEGKTSRDITGAAPQGGRRIIQGIIIKSEWLGSGPPDKANSGKLLGPPGESSQTHGFLWDLKLVEGVSMHGT